MAVVVIDAFHWCSFLQQLSSHVHYRFILSKPTPIGCLSLLHSIFIVFHDFLIALFEFLGLIAWDPLPLFRQGQLSSWGRSLPGFSSRIPPLRLHLEGPSSKITPPGLLSKHSSSRNPSLALLRQHYSSRIPPLGLLLQDSLMLWATYMRNAHETYAFSLLWRTWVFFVLRMGFFWTLDGHRLWATHLLSAHKTYAFVLLWVTWEFFVLWMFFFVLRMGFICVTDGVFPKQIYL